MPHAGDGKIGARLTSAVACSVGRIFGRTSRFDVRTPSALSACPPSAERRRKNRRYLQYLTYEPCIGRKHLPPDDRSECRYRTVSRSPNGRPDRDQRMAWLDGLVPEDEILRPLAAETSGSRAIQPLLSSQCLASKAPAAIAAPLQSSAAQGKTATRQAGVCLVAARRVAQEADRPPAQDR